MKTCSPLNCFVPTSKLTKKCTICHMEQFNIVFILDELYVQVPCDIWSIMFILFYLKSVFEESAM